jgi:hypothetical protein
MPFEGDIVEILFNKSIISTSMKAMVSFGFAAIFIAIGLRFTMDNVESEEQNFEGGQSNSESRTDVEGLKS